MFENFVAINGRRPARRAMLALAKTCRDEKRMCTAAESDDVVGNERVGFYCSVLAALANRGRAANRQLFFFTLLAQARGLSRTGMEIFNALNVCLPPRTFDLELKDYLNVVELRERLVAFLACVCVC